MFFFENFDWKKSQEYLQRKYATERERNKHKSHWSYERKNGDQCVFVLGSNCYLAQRVFKDHLDNGIRNQSEFCPIKNILG